MTRTILLSGPAACGKSSLRARLVAEDPSLSVASSDDFIDLWAAEAGICYAEGYRRRKDEAAEALVAALSSAFGADAPVIWDQTNLTADIRRDRIARAPDHYTRIAIGVEAPLDLVMARAEAHRGATGKLVPDHVIRAQAETYRRPHFDEGFDRIFVEHHPELRLTAIS